MSIDKLAEFAKDGDKNLDNLDVSKGFLQSEKPERQWFNKLFGDITGKINEVVDNIDGLPPFEGGVLADTFVAASESVNQRQVNMGFSDIAAIKAIMGAYIGMRVYSKTLASNFIFKETSISAVNDGTVLQGIGGVWEMEDRDAYFASWFASPNVKIDQVLKLQAGYDYATSKGKAFIIDNLYHIRAESQGIKSKNLGLKVPSNSELIFTALGELRLISNNADSYEMLAIVDIENYRIINPKLTGDRLVNSGAAAGEWGFGIALYQCKNGYIERPIIQEMWGDGIYIGKAWGTLSNEVPKDVTIVEPFIRGVRRNGISLTAGDNVYINKPAISKVGDSDGIAGTYPKSCIDVEPESDPISPAPYIRSCVIDSPTLKDSYAGLYVYAFPDNLEMTLHIKGITTLSGITNTGSGFFHGGANGKGQVLVDELYYDTASYQGIALGWNMVSKLTLVINKINYPHTSNFLVSAMDNGSFVGKKFGNVEINNIATEALTLFIPLSGYEYNGYVLRSHKNSKGIDVYHDGAQTSIGGSGTYFESKDAKVWTDPLSSMLTKYWGNEIWADPSSMTVGSYMFIVTADDNRELKIGLWYKTTAIGDGIFINGLQIKHGGGTYNTANCKTLGGWLRFQNIEGGDTRIIDSYGVWTFS